MTLKECLKLGVVNKGFEFQKLLTDFFLSTFVTLLKMLNINRAGCYFLPKNILRGEKFNLVAEFSFPYRKVALSSRLQLVCLNSRFAV